MDKELPRTANRFVHDKYLSKCPYFMGPKSGYYSFNFCSISNRATLARNIHIEKLMKRNKVKVYICVTSKDFWEKSNMVSCWFRRSKSLWGRKRSVLISEIRLVGWTACLHIC